MIYAITVIIVILIILYKKLDVTIDFRKEYGVIWYSYKGKRDGLVLWGSKY